MQLCMNLKPPADCAESSRESDQEDADLCCAVDAPEEVIEGMQFWDDIFGQTLRPDLVNEARDEDT